MKKVYGALFTLVLFTSCARASTGAITTADNEASTQVEGATVAYYDIFGNSESALRSYLDQHGPIDYEGRAGDATTNWYIGWWWQGYGTKECDLTTASIWYRAMVVFPRWSPPSDTAPDLIAKWQAYSQALAQHEEGHVEIVKANSTEVLTAIKSAMCETAEETAQAAVAKIRILDREYDIDTEYGVTQGARFP